MGQERINSNIFKSSYSNAYSPVTRLICRCRLHKEYNLSIDERLVFWMSLNHIDHNSQFVNAVEAIIRRFYTPKQRILFITGNAGTGKSTLIEHIRDKISDKLVILAPTGVAALNIKVKRYIVFFGSKRISQRAVCTN